MMEMLICQDYKEEKIQTYMLNNSVFVVTLFGYVLCFVLNLFILMLFFFY